MTHVVAQSSGVSFDKLKLSPLKAAAKDYFALYFLSRKCSATKSKMIKLNNFCQ